MGNVFFAEGLQMAQYGSYICSSALGTYDFSCFLRLLGKRANRLFKIYSTGLRAALLSLRRRRGSFFPGFQSSVLRHGGGVSEKPPLACGRALAAGATNAEAKHGTLGRSLDTWHILALLQETLGIFGGESIGYTLWL